MCTEKNSSRLNTSLVLETVRSNNLPLRTKQPNSPAASKEMKSRWRYSPYKLQKHPERHRRGGRTSSLWKRVTLRDPQRQSPQLWFILNGYWARTQYLNPFPLAIACTRRKLLSASGFGHVMEEVAGTEECAPGRANKQRCASLLKITQELQLLEGNTDTCCSPLSTTIEALSEQVGGFPGKSYLKKNTTLKNPSSIIPAAPLFSSRFLPEVVKTRKKNKAPAWFLLFSHCFPGHWCVVPGSPKMPASWWQGARLQGTQQPAVPETWTNLFETPTQRALEGKGLEESSEN